MSKRVKVVVAVLAVLAMVAALCACSKAAANEAFSGELIDAQSDRLVVRNADETMLFETTEATVYDLQGEQMLCVGDKVEVNFHKGEDMFIADTVKLTEHQTDTLVFSGALTEYEKGFVTVQSESLTVVFTYDDTTKIEGDLSEGDAVTVTYEGNLSENPKAISIVVIQEKTEAAETSIRGTVSEVADGSIIVSVGSAHARRFLVTSDTVISGDDTKIKVGDEVYLVYTGEIDANPTAKSIVIKRNKEQIYFVLDGVIDQVSSDKIVVRTATNSYTFKISKDTRIKNPGYMTVGHMTTITYAGELGKEPTAASIFCSKDTLQDVQKRVEPSATANSSASTQSKPADTAKPAAPANGGQASQPTQDKKDEAAPKQDNKSDEQPAPAPEGESDEPTDEGGSEEGGQMGDEPGTDDKGGDATEPTTDEEDGEESYYDEYGVIAIKAKAGIVEWGKNPAVFKLDGGATVKLDITDAKVAAGYIPKAGDEVVIIYNKDDMKLLEVRLEYRQSDQATSESTK